MRTRTRFAFPAIFGAVVLSGTPLVANSASTTLRVSMTVVRSCVVRATSIDRGAAQLDLNCASGAASGIRKLDGADRQRRDSRTRLQIQMPTTLSPRAAGDRSLEVVAVDF
jgi:hypothetical protein